MNQGHPDTNCWLLQHLNTYINEDEISRSILVLRHEIRKIESVSGPSLRTIKMHNEITKLEDQLTYSKDQASLHTRQFRQVNPREEE